MDENEQPRINVRRRYTITMQDVKRLEASRNYEALLVIENKSIIHQGYMINVQTKGLVDGPFPRPVSTDIYFENLTNSQINRTCSLVVSNLVNLEKEIESTIVQLNQGVRR